MKNPNKTIKECGLKSASYVARLNKVTTKEVISAYYSNYSLFSNYIMKASVILNKRANKRKNEKLKNLVINYKNLR